MEKTDKSIVKFLKNFLLSNFIWIVPCLLFCFRTQALSILFLSFLVSYTYLCWLKYLHQSPVFLQRVSKGISALYYISVIIFLVLTAIATYEGIVSVFGLSSRGSIVFALIFSAGIPVALFLITLFIKERKSPQVILGAFVVYVLFDVLTALPFNFLFFYDHLKKASNVEFDRSNISLAIDACDSSITPRYKAAVNSIETINSKRSSSVNYNDLDRRRKFTYDSTSLRDQLNNGTITRGKFDTSYNLLKGKYAPPTVKISKEDSIQLSRVRPDSLDYGLLLAELAECKSMKLTLYNTSNTDSATRLSETIKIKLIPICNGSRDSTLQRYVKSLNPNKPTQLGSIKQLYLFIGNRIAGKETTLNPGGDQSTYDKDTDMLLNMSLSTSIVIDILPLLLSLLYAKFRRNE